jgi:ATP-dependent RNA helicase RhlE
VVFKLFEKLSKSKKPSDTTTKAVPTAQKQPVKPAPRLNDQTSFDQLGLAEQILRAVSAEGYTNPTPIQEQAIPPILAGKDLLGCAQTGTGKTAAFALPILHRLFTKPGQNRAVRTLVLAPTRELALQIGESFKTYGKHLPLKSAVVFGGVGIEPQIGTLKRGVDILVATPGRLLDLMERGAVSFQGLSVLVLDEADRMLDMGFIHDIKRILKVLPHNRQNLLFSATIPKEVQGLIDSILRHPVKVQVTPVSSTSEQVEQRVYLVGRADKRELLLHILQSEQVTRALVFTRTKHNANKLEKFLSESGIKAAAIHGNKSQGARQRALEGFRSGNVRILVASDIAARGIDIDAISHVINFEMPNEPETYVHRIGRTGRAEARGVALSFCDLEEQKYLAHVEKVTKKRIPVVNDHPFTAGANAPVPPKPRRGHSQGGFSSRPHNDRRPRKPNPSSKHGSANRRPKHQG